MLFGFEGLLALVSGGVVFLRFIRRRADPRVGYFQSTWTGEMVQLT